MSKKTSNSQKPAARLEPLVGPGFHVQRTMCATCIFGVDSPLDLEGLLADIADPHGGFRGHRICHHSKDACCAGFWARHNDDFQMGRIAQRLGMVQMVDVDVLRPNVQG